MEMAIVWRFVRWGFGFGIVVSDLMMRGGRGRGRG